MIWLACTSLTVLTSIWRKRLSHRPKAGWGTLQTFASHLSTNSSYYCYCGETENLLIPISISHQGSAQLQSHLKAIDCGFKSQAWPASFTASWNDLWSPAVRGEAVQSRSPGTVSLSSIGGDLNVRNSRCLGSVSTYCLYVKLYQNCKQFSNCKDQSVNKLQQVKVQAADC